MLQPPALEGAGGFQGEDWGAGGAGSLGGVEQAVLGSGGRAGAPSSLCVYSTLCFVFLHFPGC